MFFSTLISCPTVCYVIIILCFLSTETQIIQYTTHVIIIGTNCIPLRRCCTNHWLAIRTIRQPQGCVIYVSIRWVRQPEGKRIVIHTLCAQQICKKWKISTPGFPTYNGKTCVNCSIQIRQLYGHVAVIYIGVYRYATFADILVLSAFPCHCPLSAAYSFADLVTKFLHYLDRPPIFDDKRLPTKNGRKVHYYNSTHTCVIYIHEDTTFSWC